jgi:hypothetical protein
VNLARVIIKDVVSRPVSISADDAAASAAAAAADDDDDDDDDGNGDSTDLAFFMNDSDEGVLLEDDGVASPASLDQVRVLVSLPVAES